MRSRSTWEDRLEPGIRGTDATELGITPLACARPSDLSHPVHSC